MVIGDQHKDRQLKSIIKEEFGFSSRMMSKIKYQHLLRLNGESVPGWVVANVGDTVTVSLPDEQSNFPPQPIPLEIVYEDADMLILNKQPGVTVHPTRGKPDGTIANGLMHYMEMTEQKFKIRFVNRLDMDTSGLLIIAKNAYCQHELSKAMKYNQVTKKYIAFTDGIIENDQFTIDLPIGRPSPDSIKRGVLAPEAGGAPSITHVKVLERYVEKNTTKIQVHLETGRTHQIRVHMSAIGHPLLGDWLYDGPTESFDLRQALHSYYLSFKHPITKEILTIEAPLPPDLQALEEYLSSDDNKANNG